MERRCVTISIGTISAFQITAIQIISGLSDYRWPIAFPDRGVLPNRLSVDNGKKVPSVGADAPLPL